MQNMANNVQFGGVKENYMEPLNVVLNRNRERMNQFLLDLTDVEELAKVASVLLLRWPLDISNVPWAPLDRAVCGFGQD